MKKSPAWLLASVLLPTLLSSAPASARWPSEQKVLADIKKYWKKNWPEQEIAHVTKKTECEKADLQDLAYQGKTGKVRKLRACLIKADVFIARGCRYLIYRNTFVYYLKGIPQSIQLGELQKAWKEGGVPAPTPEEVTTILSNFAIEKLRASKVEMVISEMGRPRPYGDFYRITLVLDLSYSRDAKQEKLEKVLATLQSDGTGWQAVPELAF